MISSIKTSSFFVYPFFVVASVEKFVENKSFHSPSWMGERERENQLTNECLVHWFWFSVTNHRPSIPDNVNVMLAFIYNIIYRQFNTVDSLFII